MISTILLMISAIHDLVLVSVVVTNCSLGQGLKVRVSEHYLVQDGERVSQNKYLDYGVSCMVTHFKNTKVLKVHTKCESHCDRDGGVVTVSEQQSRREIAGPI